MNAVEKLEAAIEKLERLKAEAEFGTLTVTRFADGYEDVWVNSDYTDPDGMRTLRTALLFDRSQGHQRFATADYIVTLHRTIEPQLAVLRAGLTASRFFHVGDDRDLPGWAAEAKALALPLADAILLGDSE